MAAVTIFNKYVNPADVKTLMQIIDIIKSDVHKEQVFKIQKLYSEGKKKEGDLLKGKLPGFTASCRCKGGRSFELIDFYTAFIILDIDKLNYKEIQRISALLRKCEYVFAFFKSPSGKGIKILVETDGILENHYATFQKVADYFAKLLNVKIDPSGKDPVRLCFMSHDPEAFKNIKNTKFITGNIKEEPAPKAKSKVNDNFSSANHIFDKCVELTNNKLAFIDGSRNNYVNLLANNCNRNGLCKEDALALILTHFNYDADEIKTTVNSAYKHQAEFGKFSSSAKSGNTTNNTSQKNSKQDNNPAEDYLKNTPTIPLELYNQMPDLIKRGALVFNDERERDVFLTGALAILSGCLPGIKGLYAGQEVFPNLFSFTVAGSASGKAALKFAKMLADDYHNLILKKSREAEKEYEKELSAHKQRISNRKKGETITEEPPVKPIFKVVYIPANSSYAKILYHLEQNEGTGIICETEADTLGNVFKQEWGGYSDMLRKSFHHEKISSSKKQNNEFIEINDPRLSVALTGTPNQVTGLIISAEDGLFSRFLFYVFKVEQKWKDVSPAANTNLTAHFKNLSAEVLELINFLKKEETEIHLSTKQWDLLNNQCAVWLDDVTMFTAEEAASVVKRLGLIMYRIAMVFTALCKNENGEVNKDLYCTDVDFITSLKLVEIYLHHSILMFNNLPGQGESNQFKKGNDKKQRFIAALPNEFTTAEAVEIGKKFNLGYSTVTHFLPMSIGKHFTQPKTGHYIKIQKV